jgi:hypothetical protein
MKKQLIALSLFIIGAVPSYCQDTVAADKPKSLTFSGFLEAYYCYDFGEPANNTRPDFVFAHNRHNEVNINLAYLKSSYQKERVRANIAIAAGTYMNATYAAEQGVLKMLYEATAGVKIARNKDLYIDAGIMPSHLGFESAYSPDCQTLTRSIIADNSPYYESGAKLNYRTDNDKWFLAVMVLNGWQRIQRVYGNSALSGGTQITYKPSSGIVLNYSTFAGNDKPDSNRQTRVFHNIYGTFALSKKIGIIAGIDYGLEQKRPGSRYWNNWMGAAVIVRYQAGAKTAIAVRGEYYSDEHGVIITSGTPNGFNATGFSANFDFYLLKNVIWRIEVKTLKSTDRIFTDNTGAATTANLLASTALAITLK